MTDNDADRSMDRQQQGAFADAGQDQKKGETCELGGCCGMVEGPGGRLRLGLLIALAVVVLGLLVYGFATAG